MGKRVAHNKLIRDNMPEIILTRGATSIVRQLDEEEYKKELLKKLIEEAKELYASKGSLKERVDVAEVLRSIDELCGFAPADIEKMRVETARARGGFSKRLFLEATEELD